MPRVTFYEHANFQGRAHTTDADVTDLRASGWNDVVSSIKVHDGEWEFCEHVDYGGARWRLGPGEYPWVESVGIANDRISSLRVVKAAPAPPKVPGAKVTIYEHANFQGRSQSFTEPAANFVALGWNDVVSAVDVHEGTWEFFEHVDYGGRSWRLGPGRYPWVESHGIPNDRLSSMRPVQAAPAAAPPAAEPSPDAEAKRRIAEVLGGLERTAADAAKRVSAAVDTLGAATAGAARKVDALVAGVESRVTDAAQRLEVATGARGTLGDPLTRAPVLLGQRVALRSYHGRRLATGGAGDVRPEAPLPVPAPAPSVPLPSGSGAPLPPVRLPGGGGELPTPTPAGNPLPGYTIVNDVLPDGAGLRVVPRLVPVGGAAPADGGASAPSLVAAPPPSGALPPLGARLPSAPAPAALGAVADLTPFTVLRADDPTAWAPLRYGDDVLLLGPTARFLRASGGGRVEGAGDGTTALDRWCVVNPSDPEARAVVPNHGLVALRAADGRYLAEEADGTVHAGGERLQPSTRWTIEALSPLGTVESLAPVARGASAAAPLAALEQQLALPGSALHGLLDASPSVQGDADEAMDGRRVPVVLATVRDRRGATRAGLPVRLLHGKRFVDQTRTGPQGLAVLRYPAADAEGARGGLGLVEVGGGDEKRVRQVLFEVPRQGQHAVVEVILDELPEAEGAPEDPFQRLPADFTPELYDDVLRLAGRVEDPILGPASGGRPGLAGTRSRIVKRLTLPRLGEKPAPHLPPRRYIVNLRQEWVFLGYTLGQLAGVEDLAPGRVVSDTTTTAERLVQQTSKSTQDALQEALSTVQESTSQLSSVDALLQTATEQVATTSVDASVETRTQATTWAVGGSLGFISGMAGGVDAKAKARTNVRTRAALNTSAMSRSTQHATAQANALMRSSQTQLNRQVQAASAALRDVVTNVTRTLDQVSPLLSRATNLLRWSVYETYAVVSRVEDIKEVAAVRVTDAARLPSPVFRDEDIVEYARVFAPALLDRSLLPRFETLRQAVEAKRNATRPISRVRVAVDFAAHVSSGELRVAVAGQEVRIRLPKGATRAEGVLTFPAPIEQRALREADVKLTLVGDYDRAPPVAAEWRRMRWTWHSPAFADLRQQIEDRERQAQEALVAQAKVSVSQVVFDYSTVMGAQLQQVERFGDGLVAGAERPTADARTELRVPAPAIYTEYDPLLLHINRNRTHYLGILLETALHEPALRDDAPQLRGFHGDHDLWRLPILGFEGDRMIVVRDVEAADAFARRLLQDPGAATLVQIAAPGAYAEALQGVLELADLKGRTPPQLDRAVQLVPPGWQPLDALLAGKSGGNGGGPRLPEAPKAPEAPRLPGLPTP